MALIKIKQIEGLSSTIGNVDSSINSLEGIATDISGDVTTNAGDIDSLEGSVTSLEGIATDIQADVTTNAGDIDSLQGSVSSLETVVSAKLEEADLGSLEAAVATLEDSITDHANSISGLETSISDIFSIELPKRDASISSLETVVSTKLEAADLGDLEASVNSLETVTTTNTSGITENATGVGQLVNSVNSLETVVSTKLEAADLGDLEDSVDSLEGIAIGLANDIAGLVAREAYGAEDKTGLTAAANTPFQVPFTPGRFAAYPYDYEVYVNGVKTVQAWVTTEFDGNNVQLTLPYPVVEDDVFTIKAIEYIP